MPSTIQNEQLEHFNKLAFWAIDLLIKKFPVGIELQTDTYESTDAASSDELEGALHYLVQMGYLYSPAPLTFYLTKSALLKFANTDLSAKIKRA
ncbi:hypothetical protein EU508_08265 [Pseudoalteromonas fuliginea]|uniref:Uncharacterized protein n=1 Tax=Pseudoalteromonas fuliginea TaxID=1872678 RepID=A0AB73BHQ7_9GAMM|nr:hypothetical protein [Pseudoalteromonas fuliginea]KAA1160999.1 hypothetical protein EU508_08265 [Pseudoalteromonas fuliginea]